MIEGVLIKPLKIIHDDRGSVMHMLRNDSSFFKQFGEIYFSVVNPGYIKGWKKHNKQTQHFVVPDGNLKLVLFDDRLNSSSGQVVQEIFLGLCNYILVRIPVGIYYSFQALNNEKAIVANCVDIPHDPDESECMTIDNKKIPYSWE